MTDGEQCSIYVEKVVLNIEVCFVTHRSFVSLITIAEYNFKCEFESEKQTENEIVLAAFIKFVKKFLIVLI